MRRLKLKFAMLSICICTYGHATERGGHAYGSTFGVSLPAGVVRKQAELSIGHAFSEHWSVNGRVSIALSHFFKGYDNEEKEHYGEFGNMGSDSYKNTFESCAAVTYWPSQAYDGVYIRVGACFDDRLQTDVETAVGLFFRIWKSIYADISYDALLISSFNDGKLNGNCINISIHYKF